MKQSADQRLNDGVQNRKCVVTIPAYFNSSQKRSTIDAIRLANLDLLDLLPEPVAAALSKGLQKFNGAAESYVLVYDFGGGTLDVSIVKIMGNTFEIIYVDGDPYCGGQDIDNALITYTMDKCVEECPEYANMINGANNRKKMMAHFRKSVVLAKTELAGEGINETNFSVDALGEDGYSTTISRAEFEGVVFTEEFKSKIRRPLENVLFKFHNQLGKSINDISEVLMVGGSIRIKKV